MRKETKTGTATDVANTLEFIDEHFVTECLGVPTCSGDELRMQEYIILWARRNGVMYGCDEVGNVYLTKGQLEAGEYYPCVTSHMDTVHSKNLDYVDVGVPIKIKREVTKIGTKLSANGIGIGADDKCGICISLSLVSRFDKIKACFFVEEEIGCKGSDKLDERWFDDVGYVIGWDSPDLNRAAWKCGGVKLFNYLFYQGYIKDVCDNWGLTKFYSEPITDVMNIRRKTDIICMNFGNGGYMAHSDDEYCILEDMDHALGMGIDIIKKLGMKRYTLKHEATMRTGTDVRYWIDNNGIYHSEAIKDDDAMLEELGDSSKYSYGKTYAKTSKMTDKCVNYVIDVYEEYISNLEDAVRESLIQAYGDELKADEEIKKIFNKW